MDTGKKDSGEKIAVYKINIITFVYLMGWEKSKSQIRRVLNLGGIRKIDSEFGEFVCVDKDQIVRDKMIIKYGKRKACRLVF